MHGLHRHDEDVDQWKGVLGYTRIQAYPGSLAQQRYLHWRLLIYMGTLHNANSGRTFDACAQSLMSYRCSPSVFVCLDTCIRSFALQYSKRICNHMQKLVTVKARGLSTPQQAATLPYNHFLLTTPRSSAPIQASRTQTSSIDTERLHSPLQHCPRNGEVDAVRSPPSPCWQISM